MRAVGASVSGGNSFLPVGLLRKQKQPRFFQQHLVYLGMGGRIFLHPLRQFVSALSGHAGDMESQ